MVRNIPLTYIHHMRINPTIIYSFEPSFYRHYLLCYSVNETIRLNYRQRPHSFLPQISLYARALLIKRKFQESFSICNSFTICNTYYYSSKDCSILPYPYFSQRLILQSDFSNIKANCVILDYLSDFAIPLVSLRLILHRSVYYHSDKFRTLQSDNSQHHN